MNERVAIIDCGTNTFNLLIVEVNPTNGFKKIYNTRLPVKLGEGAINNGFIAQVPFNRGLFAIESFEAELKKYNVNQTRAFATSAIRDAENGIEFVKLVKEKYGITLEVIDGNKEAELIFLGVKHALRLKKENSLIMDIGGGSTEFIVANTTQCLWKQSFQIGAARLLDRFKPSDPVTKEEIQAIHGFLKLKLAPLWQACSDYPCVELVGSSGAFDSLVEMIHGEMGGEPLDEFKSEYLLDFDKYRAISERIFKSNLEERRHMKGLVAIRLDMIVISCLMVDLILKELHLKSIRVSTYSLKEGALVDYLENKYI